MTQPASQGISASLENTAGPRRFLQAFQAPGFRSLWLAGMFASVGWNVESLAQGWLVLQLTDSPLWVGAVAGARGLTQFLWSVPGGAIADRFDRRRLLLAVYAGTFVTSVPILVLIFTHAIAAWHMLLFSAVGGIIAATNAPASNTLTYDIVGANRLLNASAFRFLGMSLVRVASALAGGFIIAWKGVGGNYLMATSAYVVAFACLLALKPPAQQSRRDEPLAQAMRAGLRYALRTQAVRRLLLLSLVTEFFGFAHLWMMPVMARDVLGVGPRGLGFLSAMAGVGQLLAMSALASLGDFARKGLLLTLSAFGFGLFILLFGLSPWFPLSLALVAVVGGMGSVYDSTMMTVMQLAVPTDMRGRVMGLYVSTWGLNQVGGVSLGAIGTLLSVPVALAISGGVCAAYALRLLPLTRRLDPPQQARVPSDAPT